MPHPPAHKNAHTCPHAAAPECPHAAVRAMAAWAATGRTCCPCGPLRRLRFCCVLRAPLIYFSFVYVLPLLPHSSPHQDLPTLASPQHPTAPSMAPILTFIHAHIHVLKRKSQPPRPTGWKHTPSRASGSPMSSISPIFFCPSNRLRLQGFIFALTIP